MTDLRITIISGKAHLKHTEGGDFRQATYRAVRQGLRKAQSVLLEPWYAFRLEVPANFVGRAMTDLERMHAVVSAPEVEEAKAVISGAGPVRLLRGYTAEVTAYTRGQGRNCEANRLRPGARPSASDGLGLLRAWRGV